MSDRFSVGCGVAVRTIAAGINLFRARSLLIHGSQRKDDGVLPNGSHAAVGGVIYGTTTGTEIRPIINTAFSCGTVFKLTPVGFRAIKSPSSSVSGGTLTQGDIYHCPACSPSETRFSVKRDLEAVRNCSFVFGHPGWRYRLRPRRCKRATPAREAFDIALDALRVASRSRSTAPIAAYGPMARAEGISRPVLSPLISRIGGESPRAWRWYAVMLSVPENGSFAMKIVPRLSRAIPVPKS